MNYDTKVKVELTIGEVFEIVGHLKDVIKANGGTDYTDDDVWKHFYKTVVLDPTATLPAAVVFASSALCPTPTL